MLLLRRNVYRDETAQIDLLLAAGANTERANEYNHTLLDVAYFTGFVDLKTVFDRAGMVRVRPMRLSAPPAVKRYQ